jgi:hypothetical protein
MLSREYNKGHSVVKVKVKEEEEEEEEEEDLNIV